LFPDARIAEQAGPRGDGSFLLNSGWLLRPAGIQVPLDTLPLSSALSADGSRLVVVHAGFNSPVLSVIDTARHAEVQRVPVPDAWTGLAAYAAEDKFYAGGALEGCIFELVLRNGLLVKLRSIPVFSSAEKPGDHFVGNVAISPDGALLAAAELYRDSIVLIRRATGEVLHRVDTGRRPYKILFEPSGAAFYVASWSDAMVYRHSAADGAILSRAAVGPHPTGLAFQPRVPPIEQEEGGSQIPPWRGRLFVASAFTNFVYALGLDSAGSLKDLERLNIAMTPRQPVGMTPSDLAFSADQGRLFVACSDANVVAVVDISRFQSRVEGFIPAGWYPVHVQSLADGELAVINGKGGGSVHTPKGSGPLKWPLAQWDKMATVPYVGRVQTGSISFVPPFDDARMTAWSREALENSPYRDSKLDDTGEGDGSVIPRRVGDLSPIEHVVYIMKENRTYDQIFGDLSEGNGDPSLMLFGEEVTPNHHKIAHEFVLFDNFYVNADVSNDGLLWSTAAIAPDFIVKTWPAEKASRYHTTRDDPARTSPAGTIWWPALERGLSFRNYGFRGENLPQPAPTGKVQLRRVFDPILAPYTNYRYRAGDDKYPDVERARVFQEDLAKFEESGRMPTLITMTLGNDHTRGTVPGLIAPRSAVADNDRALGLIVDAVSHSRFWPKTAIFVLEDDAQDGPDHVDSHRSVALVISPYARRKFVDSTMYNTTSVLRSIELILGLRPMTHFDAGSRSMAAAFTASPDTTPYEAAAPRISLTDRNPPTSSTAARSMRLDFSEPDRADERELDEILYLAIRGTLPPAPVRSSFTK
jgi:DNA-binding beta-propeller fold protein YncE